jgi:hypothetical protein
MELQSEENESEYIFLPQLYLSRFDEINKNERECFYQQHSNPLTFPFRFTAGNKTQLDIKLFVSLKAWFMQRVCQ